MEKDKSSKSNFLGNSSPIARTPITRAINPIKSDKPKPEPVQPKGSLIKPTAKNTLLPQAKKSLFGAKPNTKNTAKNYTDKINMSDKDRAEALYIYGVKFYKSDKKASIFYLLESIKLNPEYLNAYYNLAVIYGEVGEKENAIKYYQEVLKRDELHRFSLFNIANEYLYLGKYDQAIEYYDKIDKIESEAYDCIKNLSFIYMYAKKDYPKAIEYLKRLNGLVKSEQTEYDIALCYELSGDEDSAIKAYQQIIDKNTLNYQSIFNLASLYYKTLRQHKAVKLFQKYLEIPDKPLKQFANVQYARRRLKELKDEGL